MEGIKTENMESWCERLERTIERLKEQNAKLREENEKLKDKTTDYDDKGVLCLYTKNDEWLPLENHCVNCGYVDCQCDEPEYFCVDCDKVDDCECMES